MRKCKIEDLKEISQFVHRLNIQAEFNSGYCSQNIDYIERDFKSLIESDAQILIGDFEDGKASGVLGLFIDHERKKIDCIGPFSDGGPNHLKALIDYGTKKLSGYTMSFFFDKRNQGALSLMKLMHAKDNGNELILNLKRENHLALQVNKNVSDLNEKFHQAVKNLHDSIFPDLYLTGQNILESLNEDRKVFVHIEDGHFMGYSVLKYTDRSKMATAEVIAVHKDHRGKGIGKGLLSKVENEAFKINQVDYVQLIVDNINENAIGLYTSHNFELMVENCAYAAIALKS